MWSITRIELSTYLKYRRIYVQLNIEACISSAAILSDLTGTSVEIASSGGLRLHLAENVEYNAHLIVDTSLTSMEIRSIEC
jgi:hypothetical protein